MKSIRTERRSSLSARAAIVAFSLVVAACGGGGDDGNGAGPVGSGGTSGTPAPGGSPASGNDVTISLPGNALASGKSFIAWMQTWIPGKDDNSEAVLYQRASMPRDNVAEPTRLR